MPKAVAMQGTLCVFCHEVINEGEEMQYDAGEFPKYHPNCYKVSHNLTAEGYQRGADMLLHAQARLRAEFGAKQLMKDGPIKDAAETLYVAENRARRHAYRLLVADYADKSLDEVETENHDASVETVKEFLAMLDKEADKLTAGPEVMTECAA